MDRRAFIAASAGSALAAAPAALAARPAAIPHATIATYVANLRDHGWPHGMPATGTAVRLVRVGDRTFDPLSVAVHAPDGRRLGFLPADHGGVLAPLMDAGLRFRATVAPGTSGSGPRLELDVELVGMGQTV